MIIIVRTDMYAMVGIVKSLHLLLLLGVLILRLVIMTLPQSWMMAPVLLVSYLLLV